MTEISIRVAGPAGYGVKSTGKLLQTIFKDLGLYTFGYLGYPSLIRGGQNFYQVNVSTKPINASLEKVNILIPLNKDVLNAYKYALSKDALIVVDSSLLNPEEIDSITLKTQKVLSVPVLATLKEHDIPAIAQNIFMSGAILSLLGYQKNKAEKVIKKIFARKGEAVVKSNLSALTLGFKSLSDDDSDRFDIGIPKTKEELKVLSGNDAIALGFIKAGGSFYSAYPMTPSTNILHFLAKHGPKYDVIVRQASTEIEAIGVALGASYTGARAMVGTSGGGLDLMGEFISMLGITEIPLVIVDAQRTGPATGLPTWTEQSDLNLAKHIGHGEFPRIVIAPGDPLEAYELIQEALNLADIWQVPVLFLSDKYLSESFYTVHKEDLEKVDVPIERGKIERKPFAKKKAFMRYAFSVDGVSSRSLPGTEGGLYIANSDEHDEYGNSIESEPTRTLMQGKRLIKEQKIAKSLPSPTVIGCRRAKRAVVCWGSMKWPAIEYAKRLNKRITNRENRYAVIHFKYMYPFDYSRLQKFFSKYKEVILFENNSTGQLAGELERVGVNITKKVLKFDGEPFFKDEKIS